MELQSPVRDYLDYILYERGLSANTHKGYQSQLRHYIKWLTESGFPEPTTDCLNTSTLRRFLYYLSGKGLRPRSIHSYFDPLDGLCAFLVEHGVLSENPVKALTLPKKDLPRRATVTDAEIQKLLDACQCIRKPREAAQASAVMAVLVFGGLRRAEVCDLHV